VPVASLQPPEPESAHRKPTKEIIAELRAFQHRRKLDGISIREMIDEGRR
jgi:hypothetical protein